MLTCTSDYICYRDLRQLGISRNAEAIEEIPELSKDLQKLQRMSGKLYSLRQNIRTETDYVHILTDVNNSQIPAAPKKAWPSGQLPKSTNLSERVSKLS